MPPFKSRALHFVQKRMGLFRQSYRETLYGREFVIPMINGRKTYGFEFWMADLIEKLFRIKDGGFVDVGVNLGQTMLKVAACDPARPYLGFEPNPACADYAFELMRANDLPYTVIPAGLGPTTDVLSLQLYREEHTDPSASLVPNFRNGAVASKPVVIISIDDVPSGMIPSPVAIVKVDVEGGEAEVLAALRSTLEKERPFLLVEILPCYTDQNSDRVERQKAIEDLFMQLDYVMFRIHMTREGNFRTIEHIPEIGIHDDLALSDYLVVAREDVNAVCDEFRLPATGA